MSIRDKLIHTLQQARRDWARQEVTSSLRGFEVDAILAEFDVTEKKCEHPRKRMFGVYFTCEDCGKRGTL